MSILTHLSSGTPAPRFFMYSAPGASSSVIGRWPSAPAASSGSTTLSRPICRMEVVRTLRPDRHPRPAGRRLHRRTGLRAARLDEDVRRLPEQIERAIGGHGAPPGTVARAAFPVPAEATGGDRDHPGHGEGANSTGPASVPVLLHHHRLPTPNDYRPAEPLTRPA